MSLMWSDKERHSVALDTAMLEPSVWQDLGSLPGCRSSDDVRKTIRGLTRRGKGIDEVALFWLRYTNLITAYDAETADNAATLVSSRSFREGNIYPIGQDDIPVVKMYAAVQKGLRRGDTYLFPTCWGTWFGEELRSISGKIPADVALNAFQRQVLEERRDFERCTRPVMEPNDRSLYLPRRPLKDYLPPDARSQARLPEWITTLF